MVPLGVLTCTTSSINSIRQTLVLASGAQSGTCTLVLAVHPFMVRGNSFSKIIINNISQIMYVNFYLVD